MQDECEIFIQTNYSDRGGGGGGCTGEEENKNFLQSESSLQVKSIWRQNQDKSNGEESRMQLTRKSLKLTNKMRRKFENNVKSKIKIIGIIKRKQKVYYLSLDIKTTYRRSCSVVVFWCVLIDYSRTNLP